MNLVCPKTIATLVVVAITLLLTNQAFAQTTQTVQAGPTLHSPSYEELVDNLSSPEITVRVNSVRALGEMNRPETVTPLVEVLQTDPSSEVRGWAVRSLARLNTAAAHLAVSHAAQNDLDEQVRQLATQHCPSCVSATTRTQAQGANSYTTVLVPYRQRLPGRRFVASGWSIFGVSYFVSLALGLSDSIGMGSGDDRVGFFAIPIVGGAIAGTMSSTDDNYRVEAAMGWIMTLVQSSALAMAIIGHVRNTRFRRAQERQETANRGFSLSLIPAGSRGQLGLSAVGTF